MCIWFPFNLKRKTIFPPLLFPYVRQKVSILKEHLFFTCYYILWSSSSRMKCQIGHNLDISQDIMRVFTTFTWKDTLRQMFRNWKVPIIFYSSARFSFLGQLVSSEIHIQTCLKSSTLTQYQNILLLFWFSMALTLW